MRYFIWLAGDTWVDSARDILGERAVPDGCNPPKLARQGVLRGDLGYSFQNGTPVSPLLFRRLGNSLILAGIAFMLIMPLSLLFGLIAGLRENGATDRSITLVSLITTSTPTFALGAFLVVVFSIKLHCCPASAPSPPRKACCRVRPSWSCRLPACSSPKRVTWHA